VFTRIISRARAYAVEYFRPLDYVIMTGAVILAAGLIAGLALI